eukprot:s101_g26.t1
MSSSTQVLSMIANFQWEYMNYVTVGTATAEETCCKRRADTLAVDATSPFKETATSTTPYLPCPLKTQGLMWTTP